MSLRSLISESGLQKRGVRRKPGVLLLREKPAVKKILIMKFRQDML